MPLDEGASLLYGLPLVAAEARSSHLMSAGESSVLGPLRDKRLRLQAVE